MLDFHQTLNLNSIEMRERERDLKVQRLFSVGRSDLSGPNLLGREDGTSALKGWETVVCARVRNHRYPRFVDPRRECGESPRAESYFRAKTADKCRPGRENLVTLADLGTGRRPIQEKYDF